MCRRVVTTAMAICGSSRPPMRVSRRCNSGNALRAIIIVNPGSCRLMSIRSNAPRKKGTAIISDMDHPEVRFSKCGTCLAPRHRPPKHPRPLARLGLLMASQPTAGIAAPNPRSPMTFCVWSIPDWNYARAPESIARHSAQSGFLWQGSLAGNGAALCLHIKPGEKDLQ